MKDDGARGAEITVEDGELPYCSDCQVKHFADSLAHIDPHDTEKYKRAEWLYQKATSEVGMTQMEATDYAQIRELEHKFEDGLTVLRDLRHKIQASPGIDNPIGKPRTPKKHFVHLNPHGRLYLPHGLTECEKAHPEVTHNLASCIKQVEEKEVCRPPYEGCPVNPVQVCRASVQCP